MHLKATDPKAAKIATIKVDEKNVQFPIEFNDEEGWVDCLVPEVKTTLTGHKVAIEDTEPAKWIVKRLTGKIEVRFFE